MHSTRSTLALPFAAIALFTACADNARSPVDPTAPTLSTKREAVSALASTSVVMSNLNNPRGLAWGPEGALYVAEAGTNANVGPCAPVPRGQNCYSGSGSVSRLWKGAQERIVTGLPSHVLITAMGAGDITGPHDVAFEGRGNMYVTIGWGGPPADRAALGTLGGAFASVIDVKPNGKWDIVADIAAFEQANNPAGGPLDSNPFGILAEGGRQYVADAGGNSILQVTPNGGLSLVGTLPPTAASGADPVPTEVVRGPDGALYVSQLTGVPFIDGAASVWRIVPGAAPQIDEPGFKTITDIDWGPDGSLYVLQYATGATFFSGPGVLIRVHPNGTRQQIATGLQNPTGVLVGSDGAVYVSNRGTSVGGGEVLRIVP